MKSKEPIKVYWAPIEADHYGQHGRWNILYDDPVNVFDDYRKNRNPNTGTDNYFYCPAYKAITQNMFSISSPLRSEFIYQESPADGEPPHIVYPHEGGLGAEANRAPSMTGHRLMTVVLQHIFLAEEPLLMELTPPYLHKTEASQYGAVVPGQFDVGQWFRGINFEYQLWDGVQELKLGKDEPMGYVRFITDRPVELIRFDVTDKLLKIADSCVQSINMMGRFKPLSERYERFTRSRSNDLALKYIKENLL
jgi:hypothetical protein